MNTGNRVRFLKAIRVKPENLVWVILFLLILVAAVSSPTFTKTRNLYNVFLVQPIGLGTASLAQAIVVIAGGIDMSIGAAVSLLTSLTAGLFKYHNLSWPLVSVIILLLGAVLGMVNGFVVTVMRVPPFMATLATMSIYQGLALFYMKKTIGGIPREFRILFKEKIFGIPMGFIYFIALMALCFFLLRKLRLGRHIYAVGSSSNIAHLSGISVKKVQFFSYLIGGVLVGLTSLFLSGRMGGGGPKLGVGYELDSITAIVIGGVSLSGGRGGIMGAFGGVMIISIFSNLMNMLNISQFIQMVLKGSILILAVAFYSKRKL